MSFRDEKVDPKLFRALAYAFWFEDLWLTGTNGAGSFSLGAIPFHGAATPSRNLPQRITIRRGEAYTTVGPHPQGAARQCPRCGRIAKRGATVVVREGVSWCPMCVERSLNE